MKQISIRNHCIPIPAYDILSRIKTIQKMPSNLDILEEKTAGGIITKLKAVIESSFFENLPDSIIIKSGYNSNYQWDKKSEKKEALLLLYL